MPLLIRSLFPNIYIGTLDPISGLVQLKHLNLSNCQKLTGMILLFGNNFALTGLVETSYLQPLQNLNQLTHLDLENCVDLIGQSVFDFVREQPGSSPIG